MAGRPSKWRDEFVEMAEKLALLGLIDEEIRGVLGVSNGTFYNWIKDKPEFAEAVNKAKAVPDSEVVNALYKKALSGDTTACIFWLKNRQPKLWRDAWQIEDVSDRKPEEYSDAELVDIIKGRGGDGATPKAKGSKQLH